jgi:hypothetical protein
MSRFIHLLEFSLEAKESAVYRVAGKISMPIGGLSNSSTSHFGSHSKGIQALTLMSGSPLEGIMILRLVLEV